MLEFKNRAFLVENCQSAFLRHLFRSWCHAMISSMRVCLSGIRRSRHCLVENAEFGFGQIEPAAVFWRKRGNARHRHGRRVASRALADPPSDRLAETRDGRPLAELLALVRRGSAELLAHHVRIHDGPNRSRSRPKRLPTTPEAAFIEFCRALQNGNNSERAGVRFACPNIQIYDARVVDLYQWVCARYLVGVKGAETKIKHG